MNDNERTKRKQGSVSIKGTKADFDYSEPDKAIPTVKAATFLQPYDADNWCILGDLYTEKGDWSQAAGCYNKALSINPGSNRAIKGKEKAENQF